MPKKTSEDKYITNAVFQNESNIVHKEFEAVHQEFKAVHQEFKSVHEEMKGLHQQINNVSHELVKYNDRLERVEQTMATKQDTNLIMDRIDYLIKRGSAFDQEERVQSLHLNEVRHRVDDHEKRLLLLESSR